MTVFQNDFLTVQLVATTSTNSDYSTYNIIANGEQVGKAIYVQNMDLEFFAVDDVKYRDSIVAALPNELTNH